MLTGPTAGAAGVKAGLGELVVYTVINAASRSPVEREIWTPVALLWGATGSVV